MKRFKVWSNDGEKKALIICGAAINEVLYESSVELGFKCAKLVLKECGTPINKDKALEHIVQDEIIIGLAENEVWSPSSQQNKSTPQHQDEPSPQIDQPNSIFIIPQLHDPSTSQYQDPNSQTDPLNLHNLTVQAPMRHLSNGALGDDPVTPLPPISDLHDLECDLVTTESEVQFPVPGCTKNRRQRRRVLTNYPGKNIPWNNMGPEILNAINNKNVVRDDGQDPYSIIEIIRGMARQLVAEYPETFLEKDDDGMIIGNGYQGWVDRMKNRRNYLNSDNRKRTESQLYKDPRKLKRNRMRFAGNVNNQPDVIMEEPGQSPLFCFPNLRKKINEETSIRELVEEYSFLKNPSDLFDHFLELTQCDIRELKAKLLTKQGKILRAMKKSISDDHNEAVVLEQFLKDLCSYFKDVITLLLQHHEAETDIKNIKPPEAAPSIQI
uniref:CIDE-N domain-containing protein n=1 Tax=Phlebotomus papatasi TaxID=29031 RepID=A0A1B0DID8_PHLPP